MNYTNPERVLLIDDESINNFIAKSIVKKYYPDIDVKCCLSAREGLDFLYGLKNDGHALPEYIFLDLNMRGMDGWDFLNEYIESDFPLKDGSRIIILSSSVFKHDADRALEYQVVFDFISKPLSPEHLHKMFHAGGE
jgi:CheY-like chemotaxis protein